MTQPLEGAKKEGVAGLIKGFGKGIGGIVLKPGAGMLPILVNFGFSDRNSYLGFAGLYVHGHL